MSTFKVESRKIQETKTHPNADRLSLCKVEGLSYQFVTGRDQYKIGDIVCFFPLDAELPISLVEKLGMVGKFSGTLKNRISTVKLRGEFSQGFVCPIQQIFEYLIANVGKTEESLRTEVTYLNVDFTSLLGVTKYEPPEIICKGGILTGKHVPGVKHYDIESADRFESVVESLLDMEVFISSKIEGSNWYGGFTSLGEAVVGQRNSQIIPIGEVNHTWWQTFRDIGLYVKIEHIRNELFPGKTVIFRGEIVGPKIQGNYYNLHTFDIYVFDILVNGVYLDAIDFLSICKKFSIKTVPILSFGKTLREWLNGRDLTVASTHESLIVSKLEEGIVIKPLIECFNGVLGGRMIIKKRSPDYLLQILL